MEYKGKEVPGVYVDNDHFGTIGTIYEKDNLIHIINFEGIQQDIILRFSKEIWNNLENIIIEPREKQINHNCRDNSNIVNLKKEQVDKADTIIRIINKFQK
jgi:hypothetical protein